MTMCVRDLLSMCLSMLACVRSLLSIRLSIPTCVCYLLPIRLSIPTCVCYLLSRCLSMPMCVRYLLLPTYVFKKVAYVSVIERVREQFVDHMESIYVPLRVDSVTLTIRYVSRFD